MRPSLGVHRRGTLGAGLVLVLSLAACGGGPGGAHDASGGAGRDGAARDGVNDRRDGSSAAGVGGGGHGAAGTAGGGNGPGGTTGGDGAGEGGAGAGGSGGTSDVDAGGDDAPDAAETGGVACPAPPDGGAAPDGSAPPAGPDSVTFLGNVTVSTIAGMGAKGLMDGTVAEALFTDPVSVAIEPGGSLVVCDFENDAIRRVANPGGTVAVSTLTKQVGFTRPYGMVLDGNGVLYVDTDFNVTGGKTSTTGTIWKVDTTTGIATVVAADVGRPRGLAALSNGHLVLGDYQNARIRLLDTSTGLVTDLAGFAGCPGMVDAQGTDARFGIPYGVGVMPDGRIIVADEGNHRLRAVTSAGVVTTYAGDGGDGTVDGARLASRFSHPTALAIDAAGDVFVTDYIALRIRRVAVDGTVTTVAGDGTKGFMDGAGAAAQFYGIEGIAVTADGKTLYVADGSLGDGGPHNRIRKVEIGP
jgi:sugar lactone lactonase YvrE